MKTYFKTIESADEYMINEGFNVKLAYYQWNNEDENDKRYAYFAGNMQCACGHTIGYVIRDENDKELQRLIVCEGCYKDASFQERG